MDSTEITLARFGDPDDLIGFDTEEGIDLDLLELAAEAALEARMDASPEGSWSRPAARAILTLDHLFGRNFDSCSDGQLATAIFRLLLLDVVTGLSFLGLIRLDEVRDRVDFHPPPVHLRLGMFWFFLCRSSDFFSETVPSDPTEMETGAGGASLQILDERYAHGHGRN